MKKYKNTIKRNKQQSNTPISKHRKQLNSILRVIEGIIYNDNDIEYSEALNYLNIAKKINQESITPSDKQLCTSVIKQLNFIIDIINSSETDIQKQPEINNLQNTIHMDVDKNPNSPEILVENDSENTNKSLDETFCAELETKLTITQKSDTIQNTNKFELVNNDMNFENIISIVISSETNKLNDDSGNINLPGKDVSMNLPQIQNFNEIKSIENIQNKTKDIQNLENNLVINSKLLINPSPKPSTSKINTSEIIKEKTIDNIFNERNINKEFHSENIQNEENKNNFVIYSEPLIKNPINPQSNASELIKKKSIDNITIKYIDNRNINSEKIQTSENKNNFAINSEPLIKKPINPLSNASEIIKKKSIDSITIKYIDNRKINSEIIQTSENKNNFTTYSEPILSKPSIQKNQTSNSNQLIKKPLKRQVKKRSENLNNSLLSKRNKQNLNTTRTIHFNSTPDESSDTPFFEQYCAIVNRNHEKNVFNETNTETSIQDLITNNSLTDETLNKNNNELKNSCEKPETQNDDSLNLNKNKPSLFSKEIPSDIEQNILSQDTFNYNKCASLEENIKNFKSTVIKKILDLQDNNVNYNQSKILYPDTCSNIKKKSSHLFKKRTPEQIKPKSTILPKKPQSDVYKKVEEFLKRTDDDFVENIDTTEEDYLQEMLSNVKLN